MKFFTKRATLLLSLAVVCLALAACGKEAGNSTASSSPSPSPSASAATEAECREVQHLKGTTCVPNQPIQTLVLLSDYADYMLAIGETPYAVMVAPQYNNKLLPYLESRLPNAKLLEGGSETLNLEAVMALEPDLILSDSFTAEKVYDSMAQIAPTVVLGAPSEDPSVERWESDLYKVAEVFGKPEAAEQAMNALNQSIEEAKLSIAALEDKQIAFIRVRDKELQLYGSEGHPLSTLLYGKLGLEPSALTEKDRIDLSQEKIPDIDADYLFLQTDGEEGNNYLEELKASPLWDSVEAVRNDHVFQTDYWLYLSWGVIGQQEMIDQLLHELGLS